MEYSDFDKTGQPLVEKGYENIALGDPGKTEMKLSYVTKKKYEGKLLVEWKFYNYDIDSNKKQETQISKSKYQYDSYGNVTKVCTYGYSKDKKWYLQEKPVQYGYKYDKDGTIIEKVEQRESEIEYPYVKYVYSY